MHIRSFHIAALCCLFIWGNSAAFAQSDTVPVYNMGPIVIPDFMPEYLFGTEVQYLDSASRQVHFHRNLDAVMAEAPGVYIKSYGIGGIATPAFRGTGAGHTQLFWEGLPINASTLGLQDFSLVSSALFEDIDLVYGGGSLREGSGGLGGAIVLKNEPRNLHYPRAYQHLLSQEIGSFGSSRTAFSSAYNGQNFVGSTRFSFNTAQNDFRFSNTALAGDPEQRQENAAARQFSFLQKFRAKGFDASVWLYDTDRQLPPTMLTLNNRETQRDRGIRTILGWAHRLPGLYDLSLQGGWFREATLYQNPVANIYAPSEADRFALQARLKKAQFDPYQRWRFNGLHLRTVHDRAQTDGFSQVRTRTQVTTATEFGYKFKELTYFSGLLRMELNDATLSPLLGYLGLNGRLANQMYWKGSLSRNYRQPTLNDLYWSPGGNPNLLPEKSWAVDASWRWRPIMDKKRVLGTVRLSAFANLVDNWILWVPGTGAIWSPENVNRVLARGLEAEVSAKRETSRFRYDVLAAYAFTRSEVLTAATPNDPSLGKQLIYTPKHTAKAHARLRWKEYHLSYLQEYTGPRFTTRDNAATVAGFTLGNVRAGRYFATKKSILTLEAGLDNVWNADYQNIAWRAMPGRSFFVRLQWKFKHQTP